MPTNKGIIVLIMVLLSLSSCQYLSAHKNKKPLEKADVKTDNKSDDDNKSGDDDGSDNSGSDSGDGLYYLDDGPPENYEEKLALISNTPDAIVRHEPINPIYSRPYVALGKRYTPYKKLVAYKKQGIASWYGKRYHGRKTASGEIYDMFKMTAAHPLLPIPSYVRVTSVGTQQSIIVKINDRGPFLNNRIIDLSFAAATKLNIVDSGVGEVIVETILPNQNNDLVDSVEQNNNSARIEQIEGGEEQGKIYLQLAAFASKENALNYAETTRTDLSRNNIIRIDISVAKTTSGLYNVRMGPYSSRQQALSSDEIACTKLNYCGFLIRQ